MSLWSRFVAWLDFQPKEAHLGTSPIDPCTFPDDCLITETTYDWGKTVTVPGDLEVHLNGPYYKLGYPDKPPLKRSRKPSKANAPKKATTPPKKAKKPAKACSVRKRKGSR